MLPQVAGRQGDAEAEEGECRLREDRVGHAERRGGRAPGRDGIRQQMADDDSPSRRAPLGPCGHGRSRARGSSGARRVRTAPPSSRRVKPSAIISVQTLGRKERHESRARGTGTGSRARISISREDAPVGDATVVTGDRTEERADDQRDRRGAEADQQRNGVRRESCAPARRVRGSSVPEEMRPESAP